MTNYTTNVGVSYVDRITDDAVRDIIKRDPDHAVD